jgi:hypothetical protein
MLDVNTGVGGTATKSGARFVMQFRSSDSVEKAYSVKELA